MLKNYLKIAVRNVLRYKSFSLINITGLVIGLTTFLAISLYVVDEFSFDQFHVHKNRIYRAVIQAEFDGQVNKWGGAPNLLAPTAMKEIPEVEKAARYFHHNFGDLSFIATEKDKYSETNLFYADPEIFEIFTIHLIKGHPKKVLERPKTVILSQSIATHYFGDQDPIGQVITIDNTLSLEVTGVYQDFPQNSFLQARLIASFASNWFGQDKNQSWGNASFDTFFLLKEEHTKETLDQKIEEMLQRKIAADNRWYKITAQPLLDIRLHSSEMNSSFDRRNYGDASQVKILMALALIVILIASINYMNLTTAQSQRRNKEVGIAKTLGATYRELNRKFYFEASLFVIISMGISLILFTLFLPLFNQLSGKSISIDFVSQYWFWVSFLSVWIVLTIVSGFYPALYLSSFSPKSALQRTPASGGQAFIRKGLVVFQFSVSTILIICTVVFFQQMSFIRDKKLGYQPNQVVAVMTTGAKDERQELALKTAFESLSGVQSAARTQSYPGIGTSMRNIVRDGEDNEGIPLLTSRATSEVLETLDIRLLAGNTLPLVKDPKDTVTHVLINLTTAEYLGLTPEEAIGQRVQIQGFDGVSEVVGVTEDFHFASLHQKIGAFCFHNNPRTESYNYLLVKLDAQNLTEAMKELQATYQNIIPAAFEYTFLDQHLQALYETEAHMAQIVMLFAGLAIFVACLGLYALAAFTAEQRTKEIGIRKVMGASLTHLVNLLSRDFLILVVIAFVIGIPVGYYLMTEWLQSFAYRTELTVSVFALAGIVSLAIAWITVSMESFRAAKANPTNSLRSE